MEVQQQGLSPRKDHPWLQFVVYYRVVVSSRRPKPLVLQCAHPRVSSREPGHHPGPGPGRADPGAGFSGQTVPGQGEWKPRFAMWDISHLERVGPLPAERGDSVRLIVPPLQGCPDHASPGLKGHVAPASSSSP